MCREKLQLRDPKAMPTSEMLNQVLGDSYAAYAELKFLHRIFLHYLPMSAFIKCNSLEEVRLNINRIDNEIIKLIAEKSGIERVNYGYINIIEKYR